MSRLFLVVSLTVWRAEKLESLLQRLQRSVKVAQKDGLGSCMQSFIKDPMGYGWPVFWAVTRRVSLVVVGTCGCTPFLQTAYPAVVLDELLWWVVANFQNFWDRQVPQYPLPIFANIIVMPIVDLLHFIPVLVKVIVLGATAYPWYEDGGTAPGLLVMSTIAWTGHNCHMLKTTALDDLPESCRAWWQARQAGGF